MSVSDTNTKIANRALIALGQTQVISDLDTDISTTGKTIRRVYQDCVDATLQLADWNFTAARAKLPEYSAKPAFGLSYQYALPSDCIRVRGLFDSGLGATALDGFGEPYDGEDQRLIWRVETVGDDDAGLTSVLLTNLAPPASVYYSRRVNTLAKWSPLARDVLVACVAAQIAMPVTQKMKMAENASAAFERIKRVAAQRDAQEASATELYEGSWVAARL